MLAPDGVVLPPTIGKVAGVDADLRLVGCIDGRPALVRGKNRVVVPAAHYSQAVRAGVLPRCR